MNVSLLRVNSVSATDAGSYSDASTTCSDDIDRNLRSSIYTDDCLEPCSDRMHAWCKRRRRVEVHGLRICKPSSL